MKTILKLIFVLATMAYAMSCNAANVAFPTYFSGLPIVTSANTGDGIMINQGGTLKTITVGNLGPVYTSTNQTIGGVKTFTSNIVGNITGNSATVGGFTPSQTPVANQIPVVDSTGVLALGTSFRHGQAGTSNSYTRMFLGGSITEALGTGNFTALSDGGSNYWGAIRVDNLSFNGGGIDVYGRESIGTTSYSLTEAQLQSYLLLQIKPYSFSYKGNSIWHAGNSGLGTSATTGIDAKYLGGQAASYYLPATSQAVDSASLNNKKWVNIATSSMTLTQGGATTRINLRAGGSYHYYRFSAYANNSAVVQSALNPPVSNTVVYAWIEQNPSGNDTLAFYPSGSATNSVYYSVDVWE